MTDNSDSENDKKCDVYLYAAEINQLKKALVENNSQLLAMETACLRESDRHVELEDSLIAWQDKYERLHESHKRSQKINQSLEDKLLKLVDRNASERAQLTSDVATLSVRLAQANYNIGTLQREIERYKTDMSLAIQLLQCKPENFVSQKVASLPHEMQTKISQYIRVDTNSHSDSEGSTSGIGTATENAYHILPASDSPISTCPFSSTTTSLVYGNGTSSTKNQNAINNSSDEQLISPLGMAKYLEDKLKVANVKHCETCLCANRDLRVLADIDQTYSIGTQTIVHGDTHSLCLRCNRNLNSPSSTNSPFMLKLLKSSDSIVSDAKSSASCNGSTEKLLGGKKDELTVNPILGHTPVSDRKMRKLASTPIKTDFMKSNVSIDNHPKLRSPTIDEESLRSKDMSRSKQQQQQQVNRLTASNASSLSNRSSSANLDGPKLFESFNRNLIKSIKAEKPNVSGPRLCALRIPNGSGNILLDNIESDSCPVIYTRRNRFLDEELDETKDIITTHKSNPLVNGCTEEQTHHKISMLMSDVVVSTAASDSNASKIEHNKSSYTNCQNQDVNGIGDAAQNDENTDCNQFNQKCGPNDTYKMLNTNTMDSCANQSEQHTPPKELNDFQRENNVRMDHRYYNDANELISPVQSNDLHAIDGEFAQNQQQQFQQQLQHVHPMHQQYQMPYTDETSLLRRQQLNRVAEWVQNNSHLETNPSYLSSMACPTDAIDYKQPNFNANINDISNCSVDRKLESLATINCINNINNNNNDAVNRKCDKTTSISVYEHRDALNSVSISTCYSNDFEFAQKSVAYNSHLNNNVKPSINVAQQSNNVDLAQMEYNVKQFLLKQNEWSSAQQATTSPLHQSAFNKDIGGGSGGGNAVGPSPINGKNATFVQQERASSSGDSIFPSSQPSSQSVLVKQPHRTETNL